MRKSKKNKAPSPLTFSIPDSPLHPPVRRRRRTMNSSSSSLKPKPQVEDGAAETLRKLLPAIQRVLDDAEGKVVASDLDKLNLKDLRAIFYDAEDAVQDHFQRRRINGKRKRDDGNRSRSLKQIRKVLKEFEELRRDWASLHLEEADGNRRPALQEEEAVRPQTGSVSSERTIYGMAEDKESIIDILTDDSKRAEHIDDECCSESTYRNLTVFPVAGAGGIGKTTLVQHIYNDERITNHFRPRGWVCCASYRRGSEDVVNLTNSVLQCVRANSVEELQGSNLLLVLDDACNMDEGFWEKFWLPFVKSVGEGSIAIVTTRNYEVIEAMPRYLLRASVYPLFPLDVSDCWSIFKSSIRSFLFKNANELDGDENELGRIGKQIVMKYEGFPMDIKSAASQLRLTSDPEEWKERLREASSHDSYWITSYRALRAPVKRCALYCALFPKDHLFEKDHLIRLWVAEGIVSEGEKWVELAQDYFKELLHNFFLLQNEDYTTYKMPPAAHNVAESILGDFFCRMDDQNTGRSLSEVRHLSFANREKQIEFQPGNPETLHHLRSFLAIHSVDHVSRMKLSSNVVFDGMVHLRTLDLSFTDLKELPSSIGCLKNLRYLGLKGTLIETLPESVCSLCNLLMLELEFCQKLRELPRSIGTLVGLQHLSLDTDLISFCMPRGLGKLTNLQILTVFKVGEGLDQHGGLQELAELAKLKNELVILGLHHVSVEESRLARLDKKEFLKSLRLCWGSSLLGVSEYQHSRVVSGYLCSSKRHDDINMSKEEKVLENLIPHTNLENLTVESYSGVALPKWIQCHFFTRLKFINLKDCINCKSLPSLGRLPLLKRLVVNCPAVSKIDQQFCGGPESFPSLEELIFSGMLNLEEWAGVGEGDFRKLRELECINSPRLARIPQIASVETLKIENCRYVAITSTFSSLKHLQICASGFSLPELESLASLCLMHCEGRVHLDCQPQLEHLWVEDCDELELDEQFDLKALGSLLVANCQVQIDTTGLSDRPSFFEDAHTISFVKDEEEEEE